MRLMNDPRRRISLVSLAHRVLWAVLLWLISGNVSAAPPGGGRIVWDPATMTLVQPDGVYARIVRRDRELLCCFEWRRRCWVRHSADEGKTWGEPIEAGAYEKGNAANPELLVCRDGTVLLFYNGRPGRGGGGERGPFTIEEGVSRDGGTTWKRREGAAIYTAGNVGNAGCYEPAAVEVAGGIALYFANEYPHREGNGGRGGEQEISVTTSADGGRTWGPVRAATFRPGGRDGMPVPLVLGGSAGGKLVVAIEDNGIGSGRRLQPAVVEPAAIEKAVGPGVLGVRWNPLREPLAGGTYAGAPYLRQFAGGGGGGATVLSCQSDEGPAHRQHLVVYVGDEAARNFANPTAPFGAEQASQWNALFVKDEHTVTAVSSTSVNGRRGVWTIDGRLTSAGGGDGTRK